MTLPDTSTPEPDVTDPATPPTTDPTSTPTDDTTEPAGKEAARYRRQLREAETGRDVLAGRVEVLRRREVERLATSGDSALADGGDLWLTGASVEDMLSDDGDVDPEKVAAAVTAALQARPHWQARTGPRPDRSQGARDTAPGTTMRDLLRRSGGVR